MFFFYYYYSSLQLGEILKFISGTAKFSFLFLYSPEKVDTTVFIDKHLSVFCQQCEMWLFFLLLWSHFVNELFVCMVQDMESEVNLYSQELISPKTCDYILSCQLQRLLMCLDLYLEAASAEESSRSPGKQVEFPKEKMFVRNARYVLKEGVCKHLGLVSGNMFWCKQFL